jgi:hypothetical protein
MFLFMSLNHLWPVHSKSDQIITTPPIKIIGRSPVRNSLNITVEGVNALISVSSTKQSNDKKDSEVEPTLSTG